MLADSGSGLFAVASLDDAEQIFLVLAGLYCIDCCWWLRGNSRRFYSWPLTFLSNRPPEDSLASGWRLEAANPWPGGQSFVAEPFPCPFDDVRLLIPVIDPNTGRERYVAREYDALQLIEAKDNEVVSGNILIGKFSSQALAVSVAEPLERIRVAEPQERAEIAAEILGSRWSYPLANQVFDGWQRDSGRVRALGQLLTLLGLLVGPLVYEFRGSLPPVVPQVVLIGFVFTWLVTAIFGLRLGADRAKWGQHGTTHRFIPFLSPVSAMRLAETHGRDVLAGFEPLIVALVASDDYRAEALVAAWLRDTIYPTEQADSQGDQAVTATLTSYRQQCKAVARIAVKAAGRDLQNLLQPPASDDVASTYCPRCLRTFRDGVAACFQCGLRVHPLDKASASGEGMS